MMEVVQLIYVISGHGVHVDSGKVSTVRDWPLPKNAAFIFCPYKLLQEVHQILLFDCGAFEWINQGQCFF